MVIWLFESVHGLQHAYNMVIIYNPSYEPVTIHARGAELLRPRTLDATEVGEGSVLLNSSQPGSAMLDPAHGSSKKAIST